MIVNYPSDKDFEQISRQCLTQSFNLLYKVYADYEEIQDENIRNEVPIEKIWEHNHGTLRTSLILLHQGIETFMKSEICKISPLLLIEKKRTDWPTLPASSNKDFDSLYTISGEALLITFCAVRSSNQNLIDYIEEIRQQRNKAIHGANRLNISPKYLVEKIIEGFTYFFGQQSWFLNLWNHNFEHPLFGYYDSDYESAVSYRFLDFAELMLGRKKLNKYVNMDILGRKYFCPECKTNIEKDFDQLYSKWAFLQPNTPRSRTVKCLSCDVGLKVIRKSCIDSDCKGNVLYLDGTDGFFVCLTCYMPQD